MKAYKYILAIVIVAAVIFSAAIYCGRHGKDTHDGNSITSASENPSETASITYDESYTEITELLTEKTTVSTTAKKTETTTSAAPTTASTTSTTAADVQPVTNAPAHTATSITTNQSTYFSESKYESKIVSLANSERAARGIGKLSTSYELSRAAQIRADECAKMDSIRFNGSSHTRPDGTKWYTVFGITENYNYGENAGQGCPTPESMMDLWMSSDGHKSNILRESYTETGVGCAVSSSGLIYYIQIFYQP